MSALLRPAPRAARALSLLALAIAAACADPTAPAGRTPPDGPGTTPPTDTVVTPPRVAIAAVTLDGDRLTLDEGASARLVATARDSAGGAVVGRAVTWTSSDTTVAAVSSDGTIVTRRSGIVTITATVEGRSASARVTVASALAYDLVFDALTLTAGTSFNHWKAYRLDLRLPDATPGLLLPYGGPATDVAVSPDGTRIAFVAPSDGGTDIFVANRDGTGIRRLTTTQESDDQPAWSPDGTRIAFHRWAYIGTPHDVWVMNADGTGATNLTADLPGEQRAPTWSPRLADGTTRIAFAHVGRGAQGYVKARLYTMRDDGEDKRAITPDADERMDDAPAWSPDGRTIAFVRTGGEVMGDVWLVDADGANPRALMAEDPPFDQRTPSWSPDGALVAFTSAHEIIGNRAGDWQVYTVRADGTGLVRRTSDGYDKANPVWVRR